VFIIRDQSRLAKLSCSFCLHSFTGRVGSTPTGSDILGWKGLLQSLDSYGVRYCLSMRGKAIYAVTFFAFLLIHPVNMMAGGNTGKELHESIESGQFVRTYALYRPTGWDQLQRMPLVLMLHGLGGDADGTEQLTGFEAIAEREKFILVYPEGLNRQWNDGRGRNPDVNDVGFIGKLIDFLESEYRIDTNRVFVAGMSNGGFMTMRLACELAEKIAAVATVAASVDSVVNANCQGRIPVSAMIIQGTKDRLVPIAGGVMKRLPNSVIVSHNKAVSAFAHRNKCDAQPVVTTLPDIVHDGTTVVKTVYGNGRKGSEVIGYVVNNGGHTWPGGYQYLGVWLIGKTTRNLDASEVIWEFFKRHAKAI
jgi:polyhydroxybutyrate depolymerase